MLYEGKSFKLRSRIDYRTWDYATTGTVLMKEVIRYTYLWPTDTAPTLEYYNTRLCQGTFISTHI
jgi:hypothetical protein